MAKLFANKFDVSRLVNPQLPTQNLNQGQSVTKQPILNSIEKQGIQKVDPFGKSISMADRFKQYSTMASTNHLPEYTLSDYNIRKSRDPFGKSIKLTDRFSQFSEISSTNHLPEYVLSDYNTGYLNKLLGRQSTGGRFTDQATALNVLENASVIKPINKNFAAVIEPQSIDVKRFPFVSLNSREDRSIRLKNTYEFQKDKITIPLVQIEKVKSGDRIVDPKLFVQRIRYGEVQVRNNNLILGVTVVPTLQLDKPKLNVLVNPNIQIEITSRKNFIIDPKLNIKPLEQVPIEFRKLPEIDKTINVADGFLTFPAFTPQEQRPINVRIQASSINITTVQPIRNPEARHGSIAVNPIRQVSDEYIVVPLQNFPLTINRRPGNQSQNVAPTLTKAITNPKERHGSINIAPFAFNPNEFLAGSFDLAYFFAPAVVDFNELLYNPVLDSLFISVYGPQSSIGTRATPQNLSKYYLNPPVFPISSVQGGDFPNSSIRPVFSNRGNGTSYSNYYDDLSTYSSLNTASPNQSPLGQAGERADDPTKNLSYESDNTILQTFSPSKPVNNNELLRPSHTGGTGTTTLRGDYRALSYPEIVAKRTSSERPTKDFTVGTPSELETWRVRLGMPDDGSGDTLYKNNNATASDLVKVKIGSLQFRGYITAFSDSYTPNFADVNYIGRPDTLKVYKTTTRSISLAFKVAAFSDKDLKGIYNKVEALVKSTTMAGATSGGGQYLLGPMTRLTVGNWITNAPIVVSALKLDTNPTEYTWDINHEVPHIIDVSLDCTVLASNNDKPFTTDGTYITYGA